MFGYRATERVDNVRSLANQLGMLLADRIHLNADGNGKVATMLAGSGKGKIA